MARWEASPAMLKPRLPKATGAFVIVSAQPEQTDTSHKCKADLT